MTTPMRTGMGLAAMALMATIMMACDTGSPMSPTSGAGAPGVPGSGTTPGAGPAGAVGSNGNGVTDTKVDVCHVSGLGSFDLINVDDSALPDHRAHGDAIPGELVPGSTTRVFNANCAQVSFGVDIEKATQGIDADDAPGPVVAVGQQVSWTYDVTNTGDAGLVDVEVTDNQGLAVDCPDTVLAAGASMTCTASGNAQAGQYENVGTVTAVTGGVDGDEQYLLSNAQGLPSDSDYSHYFGGSERPSIAIEKATNGHDADSAPGPEIVIGDPVTWTYIVTNTGDIALSAVAVVDDVLGPIGCPATELAVGASMTCTATGVAAEGPYANVGTASGTSPAGEVTTHQDASHYVGVLSGDDGDDGDDGNGPGSRKVELCHRTGNGRYKLLSVSVNAEPAHIRHGDGYPGGPVPNDPSSVFDARCGVVPAGQ